MRASIPSLLLVATLAACDRGDVPASGTIVVAATPVAVAPSPPVASPRTSDRIERTPPEMPPSIADAGTPPRVMRPTKDFTDPPLPRELRDDGGLAPLPPRHTPVQAEEVAR